MHVKNDCNLPIELVHVAIPNRIACGEEERETCWQIWYSHRPNEEWIAKFRLFLRDDSA